MNELSVVIPTYKQKYLRKTLDGLTLQEDKDFDLIVIENGIKSDETKQLCGHFEDDLRIKYVFFEQPGANNARNIGVKNSNGQFIGLIDDDCIPDEDWSLKIKEKHREYPNAGVIGGKVSLRFLDKKPLWLEGIFRNYLAELNWGLEDTGIENYQYLVGANFSFKRQTFEEINGFNERVGLKGDNLLSNDELDFITSARNKGKEIIYSPEISIKHLIPRERTSIDYLLRKSYFQGRADVILSRKDNPNFNEEDTLSFLRTQILEDELEIEHLEDFKNQFNQQTFAEYLSRFIQSKTEYYNGVVDELNSNREFYSKDILEYSRMQGQYSKKMEKLKKFGEIKNE